MTTPDRYLLSLVNRLCSTIIPSESENFEQICRYSLDLISAKKFKIEDCEEQYLLSKIRHSFLKESRIKDWNRLEDLFLEMKTSTAKSVNSGELLYCLFLLSNYQKNNYHDQNIVSTTNSIEAMKFINPESNFNDCFLPRMRLKEISPKKNPFLRHTVHGYLSDNNSISCKYNLLVKDLLFIFQGLKSKHIDFNDEKISHQSERSELFHPNEIYFAQRLSVLGQCFRTIKTYSVTSMNNTSRGFVVQSFGSALNDQINHFYKLMTSIQANLHKPVDANDVTLHKLNVWTFESQICFEALVNLIGKCRSKKGGALVSVVYDMMHHGDPIVKECLRKILSKVVKPIRKMLNHWIFFGELKDEYREFFIAINDKATHTTITSSNNVFWFDQYTVNKSMLPGFISKLQAYKILITGKAISMLREVSMNKVSVVLPLYDQLKNSFENSNLETLFDQKYSYQANEFARLLDYVYREISQKALSILNAKYMLHQHFIAHKRFLLLEQGDFMSFLMELLYPLVTRSTNKIRVYTLSQTLENAIRKTCAQYEPTEILSRIDIFFDQNLQYKNAWDIFVLNYKIDGPIGTIFNEQSQMIYTRLFSLFWKNKVIEFLLTKCWVDLKILSKNIDNSLIFFHAIINRFHYLLHQILSLIKTIHHYYNYLLESRWLSVENELKHPRNLNKLIKVHQIFLQSLIKTIFFDNSRQLANQQITINDMIQHFIEKLQSFIKDMNQILEKNLDQEWHHEFEEYEKEIDANFNHWLKDFNHSIHREISQLLELLIETDEDALRELCFNIDFNKYYKMQPV
ncbi:hypothetical protein NH340_JMT06330 [Sarcoptes scabiei]|nr:hypothetical protein NH340_JMT06330 [Sarcoptes scabiei]